MPTDSNRIQSLFKKYLEQSISREEYTEFWQLLEAEDINTLSPQLQTLWSQTEGVAPVYTDEEWNRKLKMLIQQAEKEDAPAPQRSVSPRVVKMWQWAAAASLIFLIGVTTYTAISKHNQKTPAAVATTNDVAAPKDTRAVITLADGSKVYLDSAGNGTIAQENNVSVVKNTNGEIVYNAGKVSPNGGDLEGARPGVDISYNTLFNPRGSKVISLTLSDGTRVWLNSESSLKYPIAFASNTREVEITGEAYFEVKHNSKQPFKVHLPNGSIVEDIGTSFNVNAYSDEADIKTTLIEGVVKISANNSSKTIKPGEQAVVGIGNSELGIRKGVDVDAVMAWKNGWFEFDNITLPTIMRQLSRWYDLDVVYEGTPSTETFGGRISKDLTLSNVLHSLENNGARFKVEGRKVTVLK